MGAGSQITHGTQPGFSYSDVPTKIVTIGACVMGIGTVILCYVIAVQAGDVPKWLPMISDTFVAPFCNTIFSRLGLIWCGLLLWLNTIFFFFFLNQPKFGGRSCEDTLGVILSTVACIGLAVVGACNEDENITVHGTAAICFFAGFILYEGIAVQRLARSSSTVNPTSLTFKKVTFFVSVVLFIVFAWMSQDWGKWGLQIAILEWTGTFLILFFNLSYLWEFGDNEVAAIAYVDA